ncbi:hypothetical protein [Pseudoroseomonas ludipueritiae]|uniref:Uncharacterized protein n=1 Tax=Pseudoroseomonas ludipueritiae TaxID=198093 RepID=A0ABR7R4Y8_9PROT|nr:hypothetical protein [Pseudoroseomonas ludipueritiae]MBC9176783.1 hypothetical protein [Pseudoroseomonas ludipueritiae]
MAEFVQRYDGKPWSVRSSTIWPMACCDCGLVHRVVLTARGAWIGIAVERDEELTAQRRAEMALVQSEEERG